MTSSALMESGGVPCKRWSEGVLLSYEVFFESKEDQLSLLKFYSWALLNWEENDM